MDTDCPVLLHRHTPVLLKDEHGFMFLMPVASLASSFTLDYETGVFWGQCEYSIWSGTEFTPILTVKRHSMERLWQINSAAGSVYTALRSPLLLGNGSTCNTMQVKPENSLMQGDMNVFHEVMPQEPEDRLYDEKGVFTTGDQDMFHTAWIHGFMVANLKMREWIKGETKMMRFEMKFPASKLQASQIVLAIRNTFRFIDWHIGTCELPSKQKGYGIYSTAFEHTTDFSAKGIFVKSVVTPLIIDKYYYPQDGKYLKKIPGEVYNCSKEAKRMFLLGYTFRGGNTHVRQKMLRKRLFSAKGALLAQGLYLMLKVFFATVEVEFFHLDYRVCGVYNLRVTPGMNKVESRVNTVKWETLGATRKWAPVYEIETAAGRFCAGVGNIVVGQLSNSEMDDGSL